MTVQPSVADTAPVDLIGSSPGWPLLLAAIGEGCARARARPGAPLRRPIDLIRAARLGALRVPRERRRRRRHPARDLFAAVIALAPSTSNVAHILRGHFAHVEERLRLDRRRPARALVIALALRGTIVGNAVDRARRPTRPAPLPGRPRSRRTATASASTARSTSPPARSTPTRRGARERPATARR